MTTKPSIAAGADNVATAVISDPGRPATTSEAVPPMLAPTRPTRWTP